MKVEVLDKFWTDKQRYDNAEKQYHEGFIKVTEQNYYCPLVSEIAKAREHIQSSLEKVIIDEEQTIRMDGITLEACGNSEIVNRLALVESENQKLKDLVTNLSQLCNNAFNRISSLEEHLKVSTVKEAVKPAAANDDDDMDLFGSDSEDESADAARIREERLAAYAEKKSKKAAIIAKSSLVLDVKPWDDETDLKLMEVEIRKITEEGLLWGASKFVPVAFGIQKLSISCVVEDEKISIDWLTEEIEKLEDFVQSVDVAAFNKI